MWCATSASCRYSGWAKTASSSSQSARTSAQAMFRSELGRSFCGCGKFLDPEAHGTFSDSLGGCRRVTYSSSAVGTSIRPRVEATRHRTPEHMSLSSQHPCPSTNSDVLEQAQVDEFAHRLVAGRIGMDAIEATESRQNLLGIVGRDDRSPQEFREIYDAVKIRHVANPVVHDKTLLLHIARPCGGASS